MYHAIVPFVSNGSEVQALDTCSSLSFDLEHPNQLSVTLSLKCRKILASQLLFGACIDFVDIIRGPRECIFLHVFCAVLCCRSKVLQKSSIFARGSSKLISMSV